jgi:predicted porin
MKKTLVALAALASVSAFAQSTVTISGYFDRGWVKTDNTNNLRDAVGVGSNAGTTAIKFSAVTDLGAGLKASFMSETNPADVGGLTQDTALTTSITTQAGGFNNGESFLGFSGDFGELRLGSPNNELATTTTSVAAPGLSTGVGSTYSSSWSMFNGVGTGASGTVGVITAGYIGSTGAGVRGIRQANTIKYISPSFNGVRFAYGMAGKVNNGTSSSIDSAGFTDMSVRYTNGPLDVMYASLKIDTNTIDTTNSQVMGTTVTAAGSTYTHSMLGASYALGSLKFHAGAGGTKSSDSKVSTSGTQYGVSYTMGQIDLMANIATANDKASTDNDRKMTGLGVNYNFSKTTRAYMRYDNLNYNTAAQATGSEVKRTAIGFSTSF